MVKDKKKKTKKKTSSKGDFSNKPKKKLTWHQQEKLDAKKKKQAAIDKFTSQREKSSSIPVTTGDLKENYDIIGLVYFQMSSKGKALKKLIENYDEILTEKTQHEQSPKVGIGSELARAFFLGELSFGMSNKFESAFFISVEELKYRAHQLGADAVINMRQDIDLDTKVWQHFYMQMYGTAVKIRSAE